VVVVCSDLVDLGYDLDGEGADYDVLGLEFF